MHVWILYLYLLANGKIIQVTSQEYAGFQSCALALYRLAPANSDFAGTCVAKNWKDDVANPK